MIAEKDSVPLDLSLLLDNLNEMVQCIDSEEKFIFVNKKWKEILGYSDKEIEKLSFLDIIKISHRKVCKELFEQVLKGKSLKNIETVFVTKDKKEIPVRGNVSSIKEKGKFISTCGAFHDISDIKESEKRFEIIFNESLYPIFIHDGTTGKILDANNKACELFEYNKKELKELNVEDLSLKEKGYNNKNAKRFIKKTLEQPQNFQWLSKTKSGKIIDTQITLKKIEIEGKTRVMASVSDMTYKNEVKETEVMLQQILDLLPIRVFWKDKNLRFLGANLAIAKDAGLKSPREMIGKTDFDFQWRNQAELYRADDKQVIETGKSKINIEEPQTTPDGKIIWLLTSKTPLKNSKNETIGVLGTYSDITQKKINELELKKFKQALEESPAIIIMTDSDGNIQYVNPAFEKTTGYTLKEIKGKNPRILKSGYTKKEQYEELWKNITSGQSWQGELHNKKKDGTFYWASAHISSIKDEKGKIKNFLGIQENITEKKEAEEKLRSQIEEMRRFQSLTVDREIKMIELKKEINTLLEKLNLPKKYKTP